ncbi:alpha-L-fucosidase [Planctomycetota bacterium]
MKKSTLFLVLVLMIFSTTSAQPYQETWESLSQVNEEPNWFADAKFGIYTHWGPIANANVGMERGSGWYGHYMYMDKANINWKTGTPRNNNGKPPEAYTHHVKTYGDPSVFGYKDIIPLFQPIKFDAEEWADLFQKSGAQFAGPVAIHHDNFAMWDSEVTRWNVKTTAGVDVTGELEKAIRKRGLKFLTSFHHAFTWVYFGFAYQHDGKDPQYSDLYGDAHDFMDHKPNQRFHEEWFAKLKEVIDKYEPDVIWFDWWVEELDDDYKRKFMAYYYNKAAEWGREVAVCYKNTSFPEETGILDFERGRAKNMTPRLWLTDTSPGAWFYRDKTNFKSTNEIVDILVDIISKNGCMLLNVPPKPDGSLPDEIKTLLTEMGQWLAINGEAVYGTRPWIVYGEGPTKIEKAGHFMEKQKLAYGEKDIRFVGKGKHVIYAFVLGKPQEDILIKSMSTDLTLLVEEIASVKLVGSDTAITWQVGPEGLHITLPTDLPGDHAFAFKIQMKSDSENEYNND